MARFPRKALLCAVGLAVCAVAQAPLAETRISPAEMEKAAKLSLAAGADAQAVTLADALLARDGADATAHMIRSRALRNLGDFAAAETAARAGWQHARTDEEKFSAALLTAQALSSAGKRTRAQLWLRRAHQVAPTPQHAARATQDFKYVQRRNPWSTHLSFTLAPNSNINNGSARDSSMLFYKDLALVYAAGLIPELGAELKALSGLELGADVQSRYRFKQTERTAHDLRLGLSYRSYVLSKNSRDDLDAENAARVAAGNDPLDISGSDYAYGTLRLGYGFKQLRADRRGEFSLTADLGQTFLAGARYNSFLRGNVGQSYYVDQTTKLRFDLGADLRQAQRGADTETYSLSTGISKQLGGGNGLYLGATVAAQSSESARLEYQEVQLRGGYVIGKPVLGTAIQIGVGTSYRDYDVSPHDPTGRRDFEISADVTATFRQIDYYGFNPTMRLSASTTNSNIGLYDVNRVGLSIGIASAF
ncbi:surface lipoprotein assembly modifier [Pseudosulfitobacter sp. DSM 107133]|uniref:surface lipoprotein assembly modifier n=1 Tax=Pseudosulfitobacter sp. DSM 107133 TaxID=2883100 RepID=UPI000DF1BE8A|nr:surface lipoprotein assembly modifier [Pseudosulfitobacter sp. DSM 107133]UOA26430.1 hypothetical protein DSM107133_01130 [Pseudosulfitobacter sp. DSM 107133]